MSIAMMAVKLLRRLPRTADFDRHLDQCVTLDLFAYLGEEIAPVTLPHVLRRVPLPSFYPTGTNPMPENAEPACGGTSNVVVAFRRKHDMDVVHV
jgi:hypothetical protein